MHDILGFANRYGNTLVAVAILLFVTIQLPACGHSSTKPVVHPDYTTYPIDEYEVNKRSMLIVPAFGTELSMVYLHRASDYEYEYARASSHLITYDFEDVRRGDSAEHDILIISREGEIDTRNALIERATQTGQRICQADSRIGRVRLYTGTEATMTWLGINRPALRAVVRCALSNLGSTEYNTTELREFFFENHYGTFFDIFAKQYAATPHHVRSALVQILANDNFAFIDSHHENNMEFVNARRDSPYERNILPKSTTINAVILTRGGTTELVFQIVEKQISEVSVGVMGTAEFPNRVVESIPSRREIANRAFEMLGNMNEQLP